MVVTIKLTDEVARLVRDAIAIALEDGSVANGNGAKVESALAAVIRQITDQTGPLTKMSTEEYQRTLNSKPVTQKR